MVKSTKTKSEDVIRELKKLVIEVNYSEKPIRDKAKLDKSALWEKAKKVRRNLADDSLSTTSTARP